MSLEHCRKLCQNCYTTISKCLCDTCSVCTPIVFSEKVCSVCKNKQENKTKIWVEPEVLPKIKDWDEFQMGGIPYPDGK